MLQFMRSALFCFWLQSRNRFKNSKRSPVQSVVLTWSVPVGAKRFAFRFRFRFRMLQRCTFAFALRCVARAALFKLLNPFLRFEVNDVLAKSINANQETGLALRKQPFARFSISKSLQDKDLRSMQGASIYGRISFRWR